MSVDTTSEGGPALGLSTHSVISTEWRLEL